MKAGKKSSRDDVKPTPVSERTQIATRLEPEIYRQVAEAAAANHHSVSAEVARRVTLSFGARQAGPEDEVNELMRDIEKGFRARGRRESRSISAEADSAGGLPDSEWIKDPIAYNEAASRATEVLAEWHPEPRFGLCLNLLTSFGNRLNEAWQNRLMRMSLEESAAEEKEARRMMENLRPAPHLLDVIYRSPLTLVEKREED